jgi:hypothetical protein
VRCGAIDVRLIERLKRICGQGHLLTDVLATRAEAIASGNAGCTLQINAHLRAGSSSPVLPPHRTGRPLDPRRRVSLTTGGGQ